MSIPYEPLYRKLEIVLDSKIEEFHFNQYKKIKKEDIWNYCLYKKWAKQKVEDIPMHQLVNTIFSVKASDLFMYEQIIGYQQLKNNSLLNEEEMELLLQPFYKKEEKPSI